MNYKTFIKACQDKEAIKAVDKLIKEFKINKDSLEIVKGLKLDCIQNYKMTFDKGFLDFHTILN